jgi:hypothetical protein
MGVDKFHKEEAQAKRKIKIPKRNKNLTSKLG